MWRCKTACKWHCVFREWCKHFGFSLSFLAHVLSSLRREFCRYDRFSFLVAFHRESQFLPSQSLNLQIPALCHPSVTVAVVGGTVTVTHVHIVVYFSANAVYRRIGDNTFYTSFRFSAVVSWCKLWDDAFVVRGLKCSMLCPNVLHHKRLCCWY